jgi:hypothetical protein
MLLIQIKQGNSLSQKDGGGFILVRVSFFFGIVRNLILRKHLTLL